MQPEFQHKHARKPLYHHLENEVINIHLFRISKSEFPDGKNNRMLDVRFRRTNKTDGFDAKCRLGLDQKAVLEHIAQTTVDCKLFCTCV